MGGSLGEILGWYEDRRAALVVADVVQGAMTSDRGGPAAEGVPVAMKTLQISRDLQPRLGRYVLGVTADQRTQIPQKRRVYEAVNRTKRVIVSVARGRNRGGQRVRGVSAVAGHRHHRSP